MLRPPPTFVDADVLLRNVDFTWLVSNPCFEEISRGRWALGRHLIGEAADG